MITGNLGFDPLSVVKSAAQTVASVAQRDDVQRAAVAAAQAYAPKQYAKATEYADRARGVLVAPAPGIVAPVPAAMPMSPVVAPATARPDDYGELAPATAPVQKGNLSTMLLIGGGAAVLLLLLMKK